MPHKAAFFSEAQHFTRQVVIRIYRGRSMILSVGGCNPIGVAVGVGGASTVAVAGVAAFLFSFAGSTSETNVPSPKITRLVSINCFFNFSRSCFSLLLA